MAREADGQGGGRQKERAREEKGKFGMEGIAGRKRGRASVPREGGGHTWRGGRSPLPLKNDVLANPVACLTEPAEHFDEVQISPAGGTRRRAREGSEKEKAFPEGSEVPRPSEKYSKPSPKTANSFSEGARASETSRRLLRRPSPSHFPPRFSPRD
eukprot:3103791-Pyramimonas_sp.AAC.2